MSNLPFFRIVYTIATMNEYHGGAAQIWDRINPHPTSGTLYWDGKGTAISNFVFAWNQDYQSVEAENSFLESCAETYRMRGALRRLNNENRKLRIR